MAGKFANKACCPHCREVLTEEQVLHLRAVLNSYKGHSSMSAADRSERARTAALARHHKTPRKP